MIDEKHQNGDQSDQGHKYFKLMQVVGSNHKYQYILMGIFICVQALNGMMALGTPFYLATSPYRNYPQSFSSQQECNQYVCSLPQSERSAFSIDNGDTLRTLANQFGDYHCQKSSIISLTITIYYLGSLCGYIISGSFLDNIGRRLTLLSLLACAVLGYLLILIASNFVLVQIGLFIAGFGIQSALNVTYIIMTQILNNRQRQKATTLVQSAYCTGALILILFFFIFKNWKIIFWILLFVPTIILIVISYYFFKQTPQFLIKRYPASQIRQSLEFIARINNRTAQFETSQDCRLQNLQILKQQYRAQIETLQKTVFTFKDLFVLRSLRKNTVLMSIIFFSVAVLYYGPNLLIDKFGFNIYLNGVISNLAELSSYIFSYFFITQFKRKLLSIFTFSMTFIFSLILLFIDQKQICTQNCIDAKMIVELAVVFGMRFCISLYFGVLMIYINQLYPVQVAGLGLNWAATFNYIPNLFLSYAIAALASANISFMIILMIVSVLSFGASLFLNQTRGIKPLQKVLQIEERQNTYQKAYIQLQQEHS